MKNRNKTMCERRPPVSNGQIGEETKNVDSNNVTISSNARLMNNNSSRSKSNIASEEYGTAKDQS